MKQPELGIKICELRKAKRWTQEELVEKCNISIRTIQRIEAGEVTPRDYTIKTILTALDYDLDQATVEENKASPGWLNKLMLTDASLSTDYLTKQLNIAWVCGICYFILGFFEGIAEYSRFLEEGYLSSTLYVVMKSIIVVTFVFFQRGFVIIGRLLENHLLELISKVLIASSIIVIGLDILSVYFNLLEPEMIMLTYSVVFGATGLIFGYALTRLHRSTGVIATLAGIFEIVAACFSLTVVLSLVGQLILIPAELLEIMIIFKVLELSKTSELLQVQARRYCDQQRHERI